jgi:hypothetical protein
VATLVEGEHVETVSERPGDAIEPVGVGGAAVQQSERRPPGVAPFEPVQP